MSTSAPAHILKALGLQESDVLSARQVGNEWIVVTTTAKKLRTSATPPPPPPSDEIPTVDAAYQQLANHVPTKHCAMQPKKLNRRSGNHAKRESRKP